MFRVALEYGEHGPGVGEGMVVGDQPGMPPCHKLSHIANRIDTNPTKGYTLMTQGNFNLIIAACIGSISLTIPVTVVIPNGTLARGVDVIWGLSRKLK